MRSVPRSKPSVTARSRRAITAMQNGRSVTITSIEREGDTLFVEASTSGFPDGPVTLYWKLHSIQGSLASDDQATGSSVTLTMANDGDQIIRLQATGPDGQTVGTTSDWFVPSDVPERSGGVSRGAAIAGVAALGIAGLVLMR